MEIFLFFAVPLASLAILAVIISWILCKIKGTNLRDVKVNLPEFKDSPEPAKKKPEESEMEKRARLQNKALISQIERTFRGSLFLIGPMTGLEDRPQQYQAMAALLSEGDPVSLELNPRSSSANDRIRVLIDGTYPIGYLSEICSMLVERNFHNLKEAFVESRSDDSPPEIFIDVRFHRPIEVD